MKVRKDLIYIFEMEQESHCLLKSVQKWYAHEVGLFINVTDWFQTAVVTF